MDILITSQNYEELKKRLRKKQAEVEKGIEDIIDKRHLSEKTKKWITAYIKQDIGKYFTRLKSIGKKRIETGQPVEEINKKRGVVLDIDKQISIYKKELYLFFRAFKGRAEDQQIVEWQLKYIDNYGRGIKAFFHISINHFYSRIKELVSTMQAMDFGSRQEFIKKSFYDQEVIGLIENWKQGVKKQSVMAIERAIDPYIKVLSEAYKMPGVNIEPEVTKSDRQIIIDFPLKGRLMSEALYRSVDNFILDIKAAGFEDTNIDTLIENRGDAIRRLFEDYMFAVFAWVTDRFVQEYKL